LHRSADHCALEFALSNITDQLLRVLAHVCCERPARDIEIGFPPEDFKQVAALIEYLDAVAEVFEPMGLSEHNGKKSPRNA
jgi:hypothetical protein